MTMARAPGRRPRSVQYSQARDILANSARDAALYLTGCVTVVETKVQGAGTRYEVPRPSPTRMKAAMYCLDQVLGKPAFRIEGFDGATITYNQLIIQARERVRELAEAPASTALMAVGIQSSEEAEEYGDRRDGEMLAANSLPGDEDAEESRREAGVP